MTCAFQLIRASISAFAALACLAALPAAHADTRPEKKFLVASVRVTYSDLDLSEPVDAQILLGRIKEAAVRACGGRPRWHVNYDVIPARVEAEFKNCREDAVARAIAQVHGPALSQAHVAEPAM